MTAEELYNKVKEVDFTIDMKPFYKCADGAVRDVESKDGRSDYYQWLPKLIKLNKPKQVIELGGAMGVACIAMLQTLPENSKLYSITLDEHGLEFAYMDKEYSNLVKIVGDDLNLANWPKDLDLSKTDLWFIDSEHSYEQVRAEIDLYKPFFKEGAIILFDDIHINDGLARVWEEIKQEIHGSKYESDLHYSGYGIVVVGKQVEEKRDPHLIVYGSSYDRGLEHLLKMWPEIREVVPDARLRVFYGWDMFDLGYRDNPERMAWKEKINASMKQDGIQHLGRISHRAVEKEFELAGVWAFPTHFGEISCMTAMKAQRYGAIPVVVDYAALKETVQYGVKVKGDIYDKETKDLYKSALIALLNDEKHQEAIRPEMMEWAKRFAWGNVAKQWDQEFRHEITAEEKALQLIYAGEPVQALKLLTNNTPMREKLVKKLDQLFSPAKYDIPQLIECVLDPQTLINEMLTTGKECEITTPKLDVALNKKLWEGEGRIDRLRIIDRQNLEILLAGCNASFTETAKDITIKFKRNLDKMVVELLENNQTLQAWDIVKDTDWPKKDRLWLRVKHAFEPEAYKKYYSEQLVEHPVTEEQALDCTMLYPRFKWLVASIEKQKPSSVLDLGCADGYVCLTLAKRGYDCFGVNLYEPSIVIAKERAKKHNVPAKFEVGDLMDQKRKYDAVILSEVLEHMPNPQLVIDHCMSLVNKGGSFYITTPSPEHIGIKDHKKEAGRLSGDWDDGLPSGHLQIFSEEELRSLLSKYKVEQFLIDEQGCFMSEVRHK